MTRKRADSGPAARKENPLFAYGDLVRIPVGGQTLTGTVMSIKWSRLSGWWLDVAVPGVGTWAVQEGIATKEEA